jgi:hypothetical protein
MQRGGFTGPYPMGAGGTDPAVGYDLMEDVGMEGFLVDQRGPHYFDVRAETVYMTPDETFGRDIPMTSSTSRPTTSCCEPASSTTTLRRDFGSWVASTFALVGAGIRLHGGFSPALVYRSNPVDPTPGNLFSLFSGSARIRIPSRCQRPMPETERSITQSILIDSDLQTVEMTCRRYWVASFRGCRARLAGFRTKLKEDFYFSTMGEAAGLPCAEQRSWPASRPAATCGSA